MPGERDRATELLLAAGLVLLVAAPWLAPGYLFGTDWPGPRRFFFPTSLTSDAPLRFVLALASNVVSAEITTKVFVLVLLFMAAWLAYRAVPVGGRIPRLVAAVVYVCNPFVYGRFHYGQFFAVAGYAVLPWILQRCRKLVINPSINASVLLAVSLAIVGALDLHIFLIATMLVVVLVVVGTLSAPSRLLKVVSHAALAAALTLVVCAYWLIPFAAGRNSDARAIALFGSSDLAAFRVVPDPQFGLLPNLLGLYGFWAENVNRFPSFKLFVPHWELVLVVFLLLAVVGVVAVALSGPKDVLGGLRWWAAGLVIATVIGVVLEVGVADARVAPLINWLNAVFPPYRGMRDAGKWAALLALVYAQLIPLGIVAVGSWKNRLFGSGSRWELITAAFGGLALALPLYYGNGMFFGMHGEVRPSMYPPGWYAADRALLADPNHRRALYLPWHLYLRLSFVRNVNSVVASPAPTFFSVPIVVAADPEVFGLPLPSDPEQREITSLVVSGPNADWATALAARGIKYVLVAKEIDSARFGFLDHQPGFVPVGDFGSIELYRNTRLP